MATIPNLHQVISPNYFQELLSKDLQRVSLLYFWAPWAEPCKQMTEVVTELSKKYPKLLSLQIEAEEQSDISESFGVESVPSFIILRGHTLLHRVVGADARALAEAIEKHVGSPESITPLSRSEKAPAAPPSVVEEKEETPEELNTRLRGLMNQSTVVLFMKGSPDQPRCGFSRKICGLLRDKKIEFSHFDILTDDSVRQGLKVFNNWPTYPQLIIKGDLVGGLDIVQEMADTGELNELIAKPSN